VSARLTGVPETVLDILGKSCSAETQDKAENTVVPSEDYILQY
jgi:hypothetical protein